MIFNDVTEIQKKLNQLDNNTEDSLFDTRMLMYRFLSEVERIADEKNINKKTLAKLLKTSPSYITQLFRGHKIINLDTLAKIEKALGISFKVTVETVDSIRSNEQSDIDIQELIKRKHPSQDGFWVFHTVKKKEEEIIYSQPKDNHKIVA